MLICVDHFVGLGYLGTYLLILSVRISYLQPNKIIIQK